MNNEKNTKNKGQGFSTHLLELRTRILRTLVILVFVFVLAFIFAENIYQFLINPYYEIIQQNNLNRRLIFTALQEAFITYIKVAFFTAFIISSPIFLIEIWKFVAPGLYNNEKKAFLPYLVATPVLFIFGALLVYYFIMPIAIKFFMGFEIEASNNTMAMQLEAKVNEYLSLIMRLIFAFGLSFQLPVVLSLLARIGFVNSNYLRERRKYFIIIIFTTAAILTPPDPITQIGLAIPLLLLYELSIYTVSFIEKKDD